MGKCLSRDSISRYISGECSTQERQDIEAHIIDCEQCGESMEAGRSEAQAKKQTMSMPHATTATSVRGAQNQVSDITYEGYQILEELPMGGQGIVYKAVHKATKMRVALKVLPPGMAISAKARRHFELEVELAASLSHPNIVAIRDSGIAKGQHYFSMEYIRGRALDQYASGEQLSFREKVQLFSKVCDAMMHAHQRGVIHRDLKPSNILVDDRGEPHVLDFGLAKAATSWTAAGEPDSMPTMTGQIKGTVAYMSPEQAQGRSDLTDVRSDVYSLGVILYLLLTGQLPYDVTGAIAESLDNIQNEPPTRPRQIISRFDSDVEAILIKCLAKDRAERYQSAAELLGDLKRWLDGLPIVAKSVSSLYVLRKMVSRHREKARVVGLLTIMLVAFAYISATLYIDNFRTKNRIGKIWDEHNTNVEKALSIDRQGSFLVFLRFWREGDLRAESVASFLGSESKENTAVRFLLHPEISRKKDASFYKLLPEGTEWFGDFVIAERHFKQGNTVEAIESYRRSLDAVSNVPRHVPHPLDVFNRDLLLKSELKSRLYELAEAERESKDTSSPAIGGNSE